MRGRGNQIRHEHTRPPVRFEIDDLVLAGMPPGPFHSDARLDHAITREEIDDARRFQGHEVLLQIAGAIALVRVGGVFPFGRPDQVARTTKRDARSPSTVVVAPPK